MNNRTTKILIIRRSALGDTIHTLPLAKALRDKYPEAQIDWVVEDKASQFIENNPLLNKVFIIHKKNSGIREFINIIKQIRKERYDIAIDTQQLLKSAVILGFSGAGRKISLSDGREFSGIFANEIIKSPRKQFDIHYHVVKRNLEIAEYFGAKTEKAEFVLPEISQEAKQNVKRLLENLDPDLKTIVIAPETTWENKHWSIENWRTILLEFVNKANIIYTGTKNDNGLCDKILENFNDKNIINLRRKTSLKELAEVFSYADLVISPDSGSAHIAWACGKSAIITLFFSTSAQRTGPYGDNCYAIQADCICSPCMKKKCRKKDKNKCRQSIDSQKIVKLIKKVLQFD